jgi:GT2 family glycosyltransferase
LSSEDKALFELIERSENGGFDKNYNTGMRRALEEKFDYIYILNQDTVVPPDFLTEIVNAAEKKTEAPIWQSKVMYFKDKNIINTIGNELHYLGFGFCRGNLEPDRNLDIVPIPTGSGAALMFRRDFLEENGLFAEELWMYAEDIYISLLARIQGEDIMLAPKSIIYHKYDFVSSTGRVDYLERNRFLTLLWFYKWKTLILLLPIFLFMECGQIYFSFRRGWWRQRFWAYRQILNPRNWGWIMARRRFVQAKRKISDREFTSWFNGKVMYQELDTWLLRRVANPIFNTYWKFVRLLIRW